MGIQRYDIVGEYEFNIAPLDGGDYVAYDDHLAALTAERERVTRYRESWETATDMNAQLTADLATLRERIARLVGAIENLHEVGQQAVDYVGAANYASRQQEAMRWLEEAYSGALEEGK